MKKALLLAILAVASVLPAACRAWPEAQKDVDTARACLKVYHDHTSPRSATETADVEALYQKLDQALAHMSDLTR